MKNKSVLFLSVGLLILTQMLIAEELPKGKTAKTHEIKKINNNAFSFGEKLTYRVHYGPLNGGIAKFEIDDKPEKVNDRSSFHIKVAGKSAGLVDIMYKVKDEYESYVDEEALIPWKCIKKVKEGNYTDSDFILFDHLGGFATSRRGKVSIEKQTQDVVSAIYFARSTDMTNAKIGDTFPINLYMDGENYQLRFKYIGKEIIETTVGTFKTLIIKPQLIKGRVFTDNEALTLWVTDDENKLPLLIKTEIFVGSIKAELINYKNIKNPMSSKIK